MRSQLLKTLKDRMDIAQFYTMSRAGVLCNLERERMEKADDTILGKSISVAREKDRICIPWVLTLTQKCRWVPVLKQKKKVMPETEKMRWTVVKDKDRECRTQKENAKRLECFRSYLDMTMER